MNRETQGMATLIGCGLFLLLGPAIGSLCWPYTLNTWLEFFGKPESIVWWQGALLGITPFIGQFSIPAAIITWILMLFI